MCRVCTEQVPRSAIKRAAIEPPFLLLECVAWHHLVKILFMELLLWLGIEPRNRACLLVSLINNSRWREK